MLFITTCGYSQVGDYRNSFAIGVNGGMNLSSVGFTPKVTQGQLPGYTFGLTARYISEKYFSTICSIQGEVNYSQMGWREKIITINSEPVINPTTNEKEQYERQITYIQVPLMAHLAWGKEAKGFNFFIQAGPQFGYMLGETTTTNFTTETANTADRANKTTAQYTMPVEKKFDYGIVAGAGVELSLPIGHFMIDARYYYGLGNIYGATHSDYFAKSNFSGITVKASYLIEL